MTSAGTQFMVAVVLGGAVTIGLAQGSPLAAAVQLAYPEEGWDVRFPLSIAQCEPVSIFYNYTSPTQRNTIYISVNDARESTILLAIDTPREHNVGYMEWICDIPAGYGFIVRSGREQPYLVKGGLSSSCLGDITTTYPYVSYDTSAFHSYTTNTPYTVSSRFAGSARTTDFPSGAFQTITVNHVWTTTSISESRTSSLSMATITRASSPPSASNSLSVSDITLAGSTSSSPAFPASTIDVVLPSFMDTQPTSTGPLPDRMNASVVTGLVMGVVAIVLFPFTVIAICGWRKWRIHPDEIAHPFTVKDEFLPRTSRTPPAILTRNFSGHLSSCASSSPHRESPTSHRGAQDPETSPILPSPVLASPVGSSRSRVSIPIARVPDPNTIVSPIHSSPVQLSPSETRPAHPNLTATVFFMQSDTDDQRGTFMTSFNPGVSLESTHDSNVAVGNVARLNPEERATFVVMLQHMLIPHMSRSAVLNRSASSVTAPPPYEGR